MKKTLIFVPLMIFMAAFATACAFVPLAPAQVSAPSGATTSSAAESENDVLERGQTLFMEGKDEAPSCISCHAIGQVPLSRAGRTVGPGLMHIGQTAAQRVPGMSAEAYIRASILDPGSYVVEGYDDLMYPHYADALDEADIHALIVYLLSL